MPRPRWLPRQVVSIGTTEYGKEDQRVWSTLVIPIWSLTPQLANTNGHKE
jgi:hypothetical protein